MSQIADSDGLISVQTKVTTIGLEGVTVEPLTVLMTKRQYEKYKQSRDPYVVEHRPH